MLQRKYISCLKWFGISIIYYLFLWSLSLPSLEAKAFTRCKVIKEGKWKPGMACECGVNVLLVTCYVTKRFSRNMTCIDCPPGYYYEFKVFDCRPCSNPSYNCLKHNHAEKHCRPCTETEPPSPSSQVITTETPITSPPTDKQVSFHTRSTQTVKPPDTTSHDLLQTTPSTPSSTSPTTQKTGEVATKKTIEDEKNVNSSGVSNNIVTVIIACLSVFSVAMVIYVIWLRCFKSESNGVAVKNPNLEMEREPVLRDEAQDDD